MIEWEPHLDVHNESRWPPREHPLYSMFHGARLGIHNDGYNYQKAIEYGVSIMRAGERVMRERQLLINQISIMASMKELFMISPSPVKTNAAIDRLDAAIQVTSRLLRGMPIDQEETNANKTV